MILDDLLGGAHQFADFTVGEPLPDEVSDLDFLGRQPLPRHHWVTP